MLGDAMNIPEIVFGNSVVEIVHEPSGTCLTFSALEALKGWRDEALPPLKVSSAGAWQQARHIEIQQQNAMILEYDWTYTTPYTGSISTAAAGGDAASGAAASSSTVDTDAAGPSPTLDTQPPALASGIERLQVTECGSQQDASLLDAAAAAAGPGDSGPWQECSDQIDRDLLMQRDPILFYDEVPLYESEMDDNGVCQLRVKLRYGILTFAAGHLCSGGSLQWAIFTGATYDLRLARLVLLVIIMVFFVAFARYSAHRLPSRQWASALQSLICRCRTFTGIAQASL